MGVWGKKFYENDDASDVKDVYMDYLGKCETDDEAYFKTLDEMRESLENEDDALIFWAALADTQWSMGRLREDVKEEALTRIKRCLDEPREEQDDLISLLRGELEKIREKLRQPMPKKKRILRPYTADQDPWELNDVYVCQLHRKETKERGCWGKYFAIQKIGSEVYNFARGKVVMRVHFFDKLFDSIPTIQEIKEARILPLDNPNRYNISHDVLIKTGVIPDYVDPKEPIVMNTLLPSWAPHAYPRKYLFYVGNMDATPNLNNAHRNELNWDGIELMIPYFIKKWKDREYIDLGNGTFDYQNDAPRVIWRQS